LIDSVKITVDPSPSLVIPDTAIKICEGIGKSVGVTGSGSFTWTPAEGLSNSGIASPIASPQENTIYHVTVTGSNGCTSTGDVQVEVSKINLALNHTVQATKDSKVTLLVETDGDDVLWIPGVGLDDSTSTHPTALLDTTKRYTVHVNKGECSAEDTMLVVVNNELNASFHYSYPGLTVQFTAHYSGQANYLWDFGDGSTSTIANPSHVYTTEGAYNVCLTLSSSIGIKKMCIATPAQEHCMAKELPNISVDQ
jgi:PKD repeat protein